MVSFCYAKYNNYGCGKRWRCDAFSENKGIKTDERENTGCKLTCFEDF